MRPHHLTLLLAAALTACASSSQDKAANAATKAATTPLSDLNVVRADIPPALKAAATAPYAMPADASCAGIATAIRDLDEVLGPDLDAPASNGNTGLLERGEDAAANALQRTAEGVMPFRGWVRKLSGAERYAKQVSAAITAGGVRRGFLRGLAVAKTCVAAPSKAG
ncbi:hypothetical protein ACG02S_02380 [Roseateles sp. DC23W]|uniref:Uncharacterized protein n=1 Tax=Pelomonas dachongensis TaxID=3299029 RepID=A0ABW7EH10_9BURK